VGESFDSVMFFCSEIEPVRVSRAANVTSACGVGAVPLEKTLPLDSGSLTLISCVCPALTGVPMSRPFASGWMELAVRLTTITGKSDS